MINYFKHDIHILLKNNLFRSIKMLKKILLLSTILSVANVSFAIEFKEADEQSEIIAFVHQVMPPDVSTKYLGAYTDACSNLKKEDRTTEFATQLQRLITGHTNAHGHLSALKALSSIDEADRDIFISQAQLLVIEIDKPIPGEIFHCFSRVNKTNRETFRTQAQQLITKKMNGDQCLRVIQALSEVAEADRTDEFITHLQQLITDDMDGYDLFHVIQAVSRIDRNNRATFREIAKLFTTEIKQDKTSLRVIEALSHVNPADVTTFFNQVRQLRSTTDISKRSCARLYHSSFTH